MAWSRGKGDLGFWLCGTNSQRDAVMGAPRHQQFGPQAAIPPSVEDFVACWLAACRRAHVVVALPWHKNLLVVFLTHWH